MSEKFSEQDLREATEFIERRLKDKIAMHAWINSLAAEFARIRREAVAGAVEACANECIGYGHICNNKGCHAADAAAIGQISDSAADEAIERIKREARLEARIDEWRDAVVYFLSADLHGNDIEKIKEYIKSHSADLNHQLAALSGKETEQ